MKSNAFPRDYYDLSSLEGRWGCTVNDLIHLGSIGEAQICANIYGRAEDIHKVRREPEEIIAPWGSQFLDNPMPDGIYELWQSDLRFMEMPEWERMELGEAMWYDRRSHCWDVSIDPPVEITSRDLVMTLSEVARLDAKVLAQPEAPTVNVAYSTPYLSLLNSAITRFFNPRQSVDAKKEEVTEWIQGEGKKIGVEVSGNVASTIFTIIKPQNHNPKKRRG